MSTQPATENPLIATAPQYELPDHARAKVQRRVSLSALEAINKDPSGTGRRRSTKPASVTTGVDVAVGTEDMTDVPLISPPKATETKMPPVYDYGSAPRSPNLHVDDRMESSYFNRLKKSSWFRRWCSCCGNC